MPKPTFLNLPDEKRQVIEAAAIDAFAARGFEAASISRIVEQAGIAKGSFYQYFESKQDLFMHLVDLAASEKRAFFQHLPPPESSMDFFSYLRWLFAAGYAYAAVQSKLNQAVSRVLFGEGLFLGEAFREIRAATSRMFAEMIRQAAERGDLDPAVDPAVAAFVVETLLNALGLFILSQQPVSKEDLQQGSLDWLHSGKAQQIIDDVLRILEHGLGNPSKTPGTEAVL